MFHLQGDALGLSLPSIGNVGLRCCLGVIEVGVQMWLFVRKAGLIRICDMYSYNLLIEIHYPPTWTALG